MYLGQRADLDLQEVYKYMDLTELLLGWSKEMLRLLTNMQKKDLQPIVILQVNQNIGLIGTQQH